MYLYLCLDVGLILRETVPLLKTFTPSISRMTSPASMCPYAELPYMTLVTSTPLSFP